MGAASAEILRTRADSSEPDSDASRQIKALRKELDSMKHEIQAAREREEALRRELAEAKTQMKRVTRRRRGATEDDDDPPPTATGQGKVQQRNGEGDRLDGPRSGERPNGGG